MKTSIWSGPRAGSVLPPRAGATRRRDAVRAPGAAAEVPGLFSHGKPRVRRRTGPIPAHGRAASEPAAMG